MTADERSPGGDNRLFGSVPLARALAAAASLAGFAYFCVHFEAHFFKLNVDLAWLAAVVLWVGAFWKSDARVVSRLSQPYWIYLLYILALVPFATDWRWAFAGDSLGWPLQGVTLAERGPDRSLLNVNGVAQFGYLQTQLHNIFMILIEPTLFWHRFGQITVGALTVAAVFTVYARLVSRPFAILVALCSATTSVMIAHTYCSYPLIDGIAGGYALLATSLWVERDPDSRRAWLAFGFLSGFVLFLTPTAWFMALCVAVGIGLLTLKRGWPWTNPILAVLLGVIVAAPQLLQWFSDDRGQVFTLVQQPRWTVEKVERLLRQAISIPFYWPDYSAASFGPQLPMGFRWLFPVGLVLTPLVGARWFPGARLMFAIWAVHIAILTFSQGPYNALSVKRALVLIPMATFFAFLPFHRWIRSTPLALCIVAIWASFGIYDLAYTVKPGRLGYNLTDGIVEVNDRFPDDRVCVVLAQDEVAQNFAPESPIDRLFGLAPTLRLVRSNAPTTDCSMLCYWNKREPVDLKAAGFGRPVELFNTVELECAGR